jgi:hypothetical protein
MAEEYELGTVGPIPTVNPNVAKIGEMLKYAKKYADQYYVKDYVPLLGGMTLGDFLLGKAPEEVERWGQGDSPFRNPATVVGTGGNRLDVFKAGRFEPLLDVGLNVALPAVGTAQMVSKPIVRTLGPKAAEMAEDYLTKQGAIANIVEPSPKKVVEPFSAIDELGFHSPLENAILKIQQPKGTGEQFLKQLEKTPGVKTEELDVTGIKQYLLDNPTVTKQELLDQMATSRLKLQQTVLGKGSNEDTYGDYQLRGGEVFDDDDYISSLADDFHYDMKNDDVIRKQERDALLEADPDRYADYQTNPYAQARLEEDVDGVLYEVAKQQANDMYYENPIRRYNDDYDYEIYGNDDMGYSFKSPSGEFLNLGGRNGVYDLGEAEDALRQHHFENGIIDIDGGGAKFEDYTLPGKYENYREVLVTLPDKQPNLSSRITFKNDEEADNFLTDMSAEGYENMDYGRLNDSTTVEFRGSIPSNIQELIRRNHGDITAGKEYAGKSFQSSHFDEPNILAHTRLDDRIIDGKKTLFVEEIQSDWHQAGRRKGYQGGRTVHEIDKDLDAVVNELRSKPNVQYALFEEDWAKYPELTAKYNALSAERASAPRKDAVPDAPYKKNWHELMMKQIFNEAVKGNYDAVAFTTGKQQNERYNLAKYLDEVYYKKNDDGTYTVSAIDKNQRSHMGDSYTPEQIEQFLGKDMAKKIVDDTGKIIERSDSKSISGEGLSLGGEPMQKFYDEIIPNFVNKYGKKYGIGVKKANIDTVENQFTNFQHWAINKDPSLHTSFIKNSWLNKDDLFKEWSNSAKKPGEEVHFFDLSDMAKKDIKEKGQPLFSGIGLAPAPLLMDDED